MLTWQIVESSELADTEGSADLSEVVPPTPAIYMWRRNLRPPAAAAQSSAVFVDWVTKALSVPVAAVLDKELSHFLVVERLRIGGSGLNQEKQATLEVLSRAPRGRAFVLKYLRTLVDVLPAIYVGETDNLTTRTRAHLGGETELLGGLEDLGLTFQDVDLHYFTMRDGSTDNNKALRTLLEMVSTRLTVSACVRRIG